MTAFFDTFLDATGETSYNHAVIAQALSRIQYVRLLWPSLHTLCIVGIVVFICILTFSCSLTHLGVPQHNAQSAAIPITSAHPLLHVPPAYSLRPTLAGEDIALAHTVLHEKVARADHSMATVLLLQTAGVDWALPNIRSLVDSGSSMTSMTDEERAHIGWLIPLTTDPWPDGPTITLMVPIIILSYNNK